jgi:hypothetical protein
MIGLASRFSPVFALLLVLGVSACGDDTPAPPQTFAPLDYSYLAKLRLNVGSIEVQAQPQPMGEADVASQSPVPPAEALAEMAHERLFAAGTSGKAVFVVDQASIVRGPGGEYDGQMAVHLDMLTAGGTRAGFAEARVARQLVMGSGGGDERAALYGITRQMMDDMNVELEFQIRRTLKAWLVTAGSVPGPVISQPLSGGSMSPVVPSPMPPGDLPPASDSAPAQTPEQPGLAPPVIMSPPPGTLQLPPATGY